MYDDEDEFFFVKTSFNGQNENIANNTFLLIPHILLLLLPIFIHILYVCYVDACIRCGYRAGIYPVSAQFAGTEANVSRRHAPLYGRLVAEEHLSAVHRDAVHQVSFDQIELFFVVAGNVIRTLLFVGCCTNHRFHNLYCRISLGL